MIIVWVTEGEGAPNGSCREMVMGDAWVPERLSGVPTVGALDMNTFGGYVPTGDAPNVLAVLIVPILVVIFFSGLEYRSWRRNRKFFHRLARLKQERLVHATFAPDEVARILEGQ